MIIPISVAYVIFSLLLMMVGIGRKSQIAFSALYVLWWSSSLFSGYFTWLVWKDRHYSENWAMIGFLSISLPIIAITTLMALILLLLFKKTGGEAGNIMSWNCYLLLGFLAIQTLIGFLSG